MIQARNISLQLHGRKLVADISIKIDRGELVGLIGPNGAGKTTLLRLLANLLQPSQGKLYLAEKDYCDMTMREFAQTVGYLEQGAHVHWPLLVNRLVALGRLPHQGHWSKLSSKDEEIIMQAMQKANVQNLANRVISTLSGGERLRVYIARILASEPELILADEPISALDPYHQLKTMELLRNHCIQGGAAVVVMHDLNTAARYCHRLILLDAGRIVCNGSAKEVLSPQRLRRTYGIETCLLHDPEGNSHLVPLSCSVDNMNMRQ